jgi:hypothetical protein
MKRKILREKLKEIERIDMLAIDLMNTYKLTNKDGTNIDDNKEYSLIIAWSEEHARFTIDNYWRINSNDLIIEKEERL